MGSRLRVQVRTCLDHSARGQAGNARHLSTSIKKDEVLGVAKGSLQKGKEISKGLSIVPTIPKFSAVTPPSDNPDIIVPFLACDFM